MQVDAGSSQGKKHPGVTEGNPKSENREEVVKSKKDEITYLSGGWQILH